jgi:transposase InsO family protein
VREPKARRSTHASRRLAGRDAKEGDVHDDTRSKRAACARPGFPQLRGGSTGSSLVADITYIPTWAGFLYLAVVIDAWGRRVIGWAMENHRFKRLLDSAIVYKIKHDQRVSTYDTIAVTACECTNGSGDVACTENNGSRHFLRTMLLKKDAKNPDKMTVA